jgi:hypothetical protein
MTFHINISLPKLLKSKPKLGAPPKQLDHWITKMNLAEVKEKIDKLCTIMGTIVKLEDVQIEFECDDRSEGTTVKADQIDQIILDVCNTDKVKFKIS